MIQVVTNQSANSSLLVVGTEIAKNAYQNAIGMRGLCYEYVWKAASKALETTTGRGDDGRGINAPGQSAVKDGVTNFRKDPNFNGSVITLGQLKELEKRGEVPIGAIVFVTRPVDKGAISSDANGKPIVSKTPQEHGHVQIKGNGKDWISDGVHF
jgi:hypothetical protein